MSDAIGGVSGHTIFIDQHSFLDALDAGPANGYRWAWFLGIQQVQPKFMGEPNGSIEFSHERGVIDMPPKAATG